MAHFVRTRPFKPHSGNLAFRKPPAPLGANPARPAPRGLWPAHPAALLCPCGHFGRAFPRWEGTRDFVCLGIRGLWVWTRGGGVQTSGGGWVGPDPGGGRWAGPKKPLRGPLASLHGGHLALHHRRLRVPHGGAAAAVPRRARLRAAAARGPGGPGHPRPHPAQRVGPGVAPCRVSPSRRFHSAWPAGGGT